MPPHAVALLATPVVRGSTDSSHYTNEEFLARHAAS
jgi:hypothetical protein